MGRYLDLAREVQIRGVEPPVSPPGVGIPDEKPPIQRTDNIESGYIQCVLDGHIVVQTLYEKDGVVIFVDSQGLVWRYLRSWNLAWPAPWATRRGVRLDATKGNYPWGQDENRKRKGKLTMEAENADQGSRGIQ